MILAELVRYADDHDLVEVEGYQLRPIRFLVHIRNDGSLLNIEDTLQDDPTGRKPRAKSFLAPNPPKRTVNPVAAALVDNATFIFGIAPKEKPERLKACTSDFRRIIRAVAEATKNAAALAPMRFL
jgi:hypothetical protein